MTDNISGKVVVITGGSAGIGRAAGFMQPIQECRLRCISTRGSTRGMSPGWSNSGSLA